MEAHIKVNGLQHDHIARIFLYGVASISSKHFIKRILNLAQKYKMLNLAS